MVTILLKANEFEDGQRVRKATGNKLYILRKSVKLFGTEQPGFPGNVIIAEHGQVFLVNENGDINIIPGDLQLAVDFQSLEESSEFLRNMILGREQENSQ